MCSDLRPLRPCLDHRLGVHIRGGGGGGTPLYKPYRYVPAPQRVWFLGRFGQEKGLDFVYFGLESGMVFQETTDVYERIYRFNSK